MRLPAADAVFRQNLLRAAELSSVPILAASRPDASAYRLRERLVAARKAVANGDADDPLVEVVALVIGAAGYRPTQLGGVLRQGRSVALLLERLEAAGVRTREIVRERL